MSALDRAVDAAWRAVRPHARRLALVVLEAATTARAITTMAVVEVLVRTVPLPRLSRLLGCRVDVASTQVRREVISPSELSRRDRRRLRCTYRVARAWPFSEGPCLRRTLVGGHLVRDLDPSVRLGLTGSEQDLSAHAWLELDGRPVEDVDGYVPFERATREEAS